MNKDTIIKAGTLLEEMQRVTDEVPAAVHRAVDASIKALEGKVDAEMLRVKACEHIAEGVAGWERLRNECPSTQAVAALRDELAAVKAERDALCAKLSDPGTTHSEDCWAWGAKHYECAMQEIERLNALINTPHTHDFIEAVKLEMAHQRARWGTDHDAGKTPADWFWLVGYLAGKALHAVGAGNTEKAKHHVITTAAALGNWFLAITGEDVRMRPGIGPPAAVAAQGEGDAA